MIHLQDAERELAAASVAPTRLLPNSMCLFCWYGTGASMAVQLMMSVRAVTSRLCNSSE